MSKLLQQQYIRAYNMRPNLDCNSWSVAPSLLPHWRAQAVVNQAEQQRLHALAWMRKNFDQAQVPTASFLTNSGPVNFIRFYIMLVQHSDFHLITFCLFRQ